MGNTPEASIPVACGGWAETKATYRFFDNNNVNATKILASHREASLERIKCPNVPCHIIFAEEEWKVAYMMTYRKKSPKKPITLSMMIGLVAQFGGYLNRASDSKPGPTTIWIELRKLHNFIEAKKIYDDIR